MATSARPVPTGALAPQRRGPDDDFDRLFEQVRQERASPTERGGGQDDDFDRLFEQVRLERRAPSEPIRMEPAVVMAEPPQPEPSPAGRPMRGRAPRGSVLAEAQRMGMSREASTIPAGRLPRDISNAVAGARTGRKESDIGRLGFAELHGVLSPAQRARLDWLEREVQKQPAGSGFWYEAGRIVGQMADPLTKELPRGAAAGLLGAAAAGVLGGGPAGAAAVGGAGAAVGALSGMQQYTFIVEAGQAYREMGRVRGVTDQPLDEDTRRYAALGVGALNSGLELGGLALVTAPIRAGMKRFTKRAAADALRNPTVRDRLAAIGKAYAGAVLGESGTEGLQEVSNVLGTELAKLGSAGTFRDLRDPQVRSDALAQIADVTIRTAKGMSLLGVPGAVVAAVGHPSPTPTAPSTATAPAPRPGPVPSISAEPTRVDALVAERAAQRAREVDALVTELQQRRRPAREAEVVPPAEGTVPAVVPEVVPPERSESAIPPADAPRMVGPAAIRLPDGQIFTGQTHIQAVERASESLGTPIESGRFEAPETVHGFLDTAGRFLTRRQAARLARETGQATREEIARRADELRAEGVAIRRDELTAEKMVPAARVRAEQVPSRVSGTPPVTEPPAEPPAEQIPAAAPTSRRRGRKPPPGDTPPALEPPTGQVPGEGLSALSDADLAATAERLEQELYGPSAVRTPDPESVSRLLAVQAERRRRVPVPPAVQSVRAARSGQPFRARLFRGHGRGPDSPSPYGELSAGVPILGPGLYATPSPSYAATFGPDVMELEVVLENPLVVTTDADWRRLTTAAGWAVANPVGLPHAEQVRMLRAMRDRVEAAGHDGVIVRLPRAPESGPGEYDIDERVGKTIAKLFDEDTVVAFRQPVAAASPSVAQPDATDRQAGDESTAIPEDGDVADEGPESDLAFSPDRRTIEGQTVPPPDPLWPGPAPAPSPIAGQNVIGEQLTGNLVRPPSYQSGQPVGPQHVMEALAQVLEAAGKKIPFRTGVGRYRKARGYFDVKQEVNRLRMANSIAAGWHETAHALEKLVYGWPKGSPWRLPRIGRAMQQELVALGKALYGATRPAAGYKREGFAEYVRRWGTGQDPDQAAPIFHQWFETEFLAEYDEIAAKVQAARDLTTRYRLQGSRERAKAALVLSQTLRERLKASVQWMKAALALRLHVDMFEPYSKLAEEMAKRLGRPLRESENPFAVSEWLALTHSPVVKYMVWHGMLDIVRYPVGPSLAEIIPLIKGRYTDFVLYLWARRSKALWLDPIHGPRNPGLSLEDAIQLVEELGSDAFDLAAAKVYAWFDGVMNYAAQASPTYALAVDAIRKGDPGDYVPLFREFEALDARYRSLGGSALRGSLSQRLKGSGLRVKDTFVSLIAKAEQIVQLSHERMVVDTIVKAASIEGMGHVIEEVPVGLRPAASASVADLMDRMNAVLGGPMADVHIRAESVTGEPIDYQELADAAVTFFAPIQDPGAGGKPIVPVVREGVLRWYYLDPDLYHALKGLDRVTLRSLTSIPLLNWALHWGLEQPAKLARAGYVGFRASFGLSWNLQRDLQEFYKNTQSNANPMKLAKEWWRSLVAAGLYRTTGRKNDAIDLFIRLGGEMAMSLGLDQSSTKRTARELAQSPRRRAIDVRNWPDFYRDLVQFPEIAPRAAEISLLMAEEGIPMGQRLTLDQAIRLGRASKNVTVNFASAGEVSRVVNQMVPFYNVSFQGPRASVRAARHHPRRFASRALQIAVLSLLIWWSQKDEEWYKRLTDRQRMLHWHFAFKRKDGTTQLVRIPRSYEGGLWFGGLTEAIADSWYRHDPESMQAWMKTTWESTSPFGWPVLMSEMLQQAENRDAFTGVPIETMGEERRPPRERYNEYTTAAAKAVGRLFNVSPKRIDHAVRTIAGGVAMDILDLLGLGATLREREFEPSDIPIVGRSFVRGGTGAGAKPVDQLFEALRAAQERQASIEQPETPTERHRRLVLEDAAKAVKVLLSARRIEQRTAIRQRLTVEAARYAARALRERAPRLPPAVKRQLRQQDKLTRQRRGGR